MTTLEIIFGIMVAGQWPAIGWMYKRQADFREEIPKTYVTKQDLIAAEERNENNTDKIVNSIEGLRDDIKENNKTTQDIMLKVVKLEESNKNK